MRFDPADGSKPVQSTVKTGTLAAPPQQNPQRESFRFDGWTLDNQPFDFQTPILQDATLKAQWTKITDWTLSPNHGPATGTRLTISPPDRQEPYYASVQAAGEQLVGLTGDGRIYVWKRDSTPKQVPAPAQAPEGFRYLQAATGSRWQAALGSDQQIYTWTSQQAVPTILDTSQSTRFTSISLNDDRLLAVDRQGQVHAFQASQNSNSKPDGQETISLPGKTQAVLAAASSSRILALDSDGQAWTWDADKSGSVKPERVKQDPGMRLTQAQALSKGFLLLDSKGQPRYLADSTTSPATVDLPDAVRASRITTSKDQAVIIDTDGHVWTWKPGSKPTRADNGNQQYGQAASTGSRITAIDRQGSIFTWNPDAQSNQGKPARIDTIQAPILESASLDGRPLKLSRKNDTWQTDAPACKPGPVSLVIAGRQDGQPFTRSLKYTVDQTLTRNDQRGTNYTVRFNTGEGNPTPQDQSIQPVYGRVQRPTPDPTREGYQFDGWFIGQVAYDFSRPVDKDLTLTAHWTPASRNSRWSISPDKGSLLGKETTTITPPDSASRGIRFSQVSASQNRSFSLAVGSDGNAYAWGYNGSGQLGDGTRTQRNTPVRVRTPDRNTYPDLPKDFTYVQVNAGDSHSLALGSDGYAYAWGSNDYGQLGNGTDTGYRTTTPVKVSKPAGAPVDFTYVQISAGWNYSVALGSDGNAYAWGYNGSGQLGDGTRTQRNTPVRVRTPDRNTYPDLPKDFTYVQISAGQMHSLALGSDGYAYAWGSNNSGQLGNGTTSYSSVPVLVRNPANPTDTSKGLKATQVSAGWNHSVALGSDGYAYAWGDNYWGQLGNNSTYTISYVPVHVRNPANPTDTNKGLKATQVSAGQMQSLAVGNDGYAYAWGSNNSGQLGNGTTSYSSVPVLVRDPASPTDTNKGLKATQVFCRGGHSIAISTDGNTYAWGYNGCGQLGNDSIPTGQLNSNSYSPVPVPVAFNLALVITGVRFDQTPVSGLTRGDGSSVTVLTPAHQPGTVTVSVDYTLGGAPQTPDTSLRYTYLPAGVLPKAGGEGILLALATGMTGMGGVLASRRHRREQHQLLHASHE